jgi:hypothetical protein
MQHGSDADARAEMPGVSGDGEHGLGGGLEQHVVDLPLVLPGDVGDGGRQREHQVEVTGIEQLGLTLGQPFARRGGLTLRTAPCYGNY